MSSAAQRAAAGPNALPVADAVMVGVGARTHTGLTALQTTMSLRALKMDSRESHLIDKHGEPMGICRLACISDHVMGLDRFVALGGPALTQAAFGWTSAERRKSQAARPLPVVVAVPSKTRPGVDARLGQHLLRGLEARSQVPIDHVRSTLTFGCRAGGVQAFQIALEKLREDGCDAIAVGGIDSWFDPDALEWLDQELRLHSPETENGFIPGEGAAFVLLARRRVAASLERLGQVLAVGVAEEPRPYGSEEPCLGVGITAAVRQAVGAVGPKSRRIPWMLTDVVNERHRVAEWSYAMARAHQAFSEGVVHEQPLLKTGDLGAASAATLAVVAAVRWQTRCAPGDCALLGLHSDGGGRGAMLIAADAT